MQLNARSVRRPGVTIGELGSIGELVGAVATVATLLYLAIQIRANTLSTKRQALDDTIDRIIRWQCRLAESPDNVRCWIDGHRDFAGLSFEDRVRFTSLMSEILAAFEATFEAAKSGDVKPETVEAVRVLTLQMFRSKGVREYWDTTALFASDFMNEVHEISEQARRTPEGAPGYLPYHVPPVEM
jgi:hypothetical protein